MKESTNYHDANNKFSLLSTHEDIDTSESESELTEMECDEDDNNGKKDKTTTDKAPTQIKKNEKPPPIVMHGKQCPHGTLKELADRATKNGINIRYTTKKTIIFTNSLEDHQKLRDELAKLIDG